MTEVPKPPTDRSERFSTEKLSREEIRRLVQAVDDVYFSGPDIDEAKNVDAQQANALEIPPLNSGHLAGEKGYIG